MKKSCVKKIMQSTTIASELIFTLVHGVGFAFQAYPPRTSANQTASKSDIDLTAQIRKSIQADKDLSAAAHSVKVVSQNGKVTLTGKVASDAERSAIVQKARDLAGEGNVTDNLTVAQK